MEGEEKLLFFYAGPSKNSRLFQATEIDDIERRQIQQPFHEFRCRRDKLRLPMFE